ncbi:MAG TPA: MFS transporter [Pseudonocardia sp.]|nr:MFS transporter [Pseudonocardia sp.]
MLAVLLAGQFMANVDNAIVNIAVPSVAAGFGAPPGQVALLAAGYLVAFAVLLVTGARLGATHGQRRVFLVGLLGFTVASLAAGLAPGLGWLLLARVVQGASAALLVPQVLSGIQLHFAGPDRVRALGYYAIALSGGAVAGQVLGGVLIAADLFGTGWRPIFLINVPLGLALLLAGRRLLPETPRRPGGLDWPGVAALSGAVLLLVLPLVLGPDRHWPAWAWLCLAASAPALLGFAALQRRVAVRGGRPLVAPTLWRHRQVRLGLLAHGLTTLTYFALLFVVALYLQQGLGRSPAYAGLAMVAWVAAFGLAGPLLPRLPARYLAAAPRVGCLILAGGYLSVAGYLFAGGLAGAPLFALLGVGGLGLGISANSLIGAMTSALPDGYAADLSGVITTNAQLSGAVGVAVASTGYLAARAGLAPADAFAVVLVGFGVLAVLASVAAAGAAAPRPAPEPASSTAR